MADWERDWAWPSVGASWKPTEAAFGLRATGWGLGAKFTFTLPTAPESDTLLPRSPGRSAGRGRQRVRVLAVDDDPQTLRYLRDTLAEAGYAVSVAGEPEEALRLVERERPHLVLLDLILPGADGLALMQSILAVADVPVIFLSGYGRDRIIAQAFDLGAEDYIVKPFSPTELVARIQAALRRRAAPPRVEPPEPYVLGDLVIDFVHRRVTVAGQEAQLTATEYDLLAELAVNAGARGETPGTAAPGVGTRQLRQRLHHPHPPDAAAPEAGRGRREPHLHLLRTQGGLPHGCGGDKRAVGTGAGG